MRKGNKTAYKLTFNDALSAAEYIIKGEHQLDKICKECKDALRLLKVIRRQLSNMTIDDNLVWYAYKAYKSAQSER